MAETPNIRLDITGEKCPMTFVKTRLLLEKTSQGQVVEILMSAGEPSDNLPQSVKDLGHHVEALNPLDDGASFLMRVRVG